MKKIILVLSLTSVCALTTYSQRTVTQTSGQASNETSMSVNKADRGIDIQSGTRLVAELQNSVDVRKAKAGDQIVLRTTHAIKSQGHTVVSKGARLIGHVTEVVQKTKANAASRIGFVFDRLERGSLEFPISATITSIASGRASTRAGDEDLFGSDARSNTAAHSTSSGGGLLGGTTSTVGSVVNTAGNVVGGTTAVVGTTVNSTAGVVGATGTRMGRSVGNIQISQSSSTSAEGGALLSLRGENLRLEKGTTFDLMIQQSANASTSKAQ